MVINTGKIGELFFTKENGEIVVNNTSLVAIGEAQRAVSGSSYSEEEILADVMQLRYGEKTNEDKEGRGFSGKYHQFISTPSF